MAIGIEACEEIFPKGWYSVARPGQARPVKRLPDDCVQLFLEYLLSEDQFAALASLISGRPDVLLKAMYGATSELDWLSLLPGHTAFELYLIDESPVEKLALLPDSTLRLCVRGWAPKVNLTVIQHLTSLKHAEFDNVQRGYDALLNAEKLESLLIRSAKRLDTSFLPQLKSLTSLDLKIGSLADSEPIGDCRALKYLEIWGSHGLSDLSFITRLESLQYLFLEQLHQVERLPDLSRMVDLRRVWLERFNRLQSLEPVHSAPALEELAVIYCMALADDDYRHLDRCKMLKRVKLFLKSLRATGHIVSICPIKGGAFDKWDFEYR